MALQPYTFDRELLGRRRIPDNKQFRAQLNTQSSLVLSALLDLLPSNYPKNESTNLAILFRILAREAARQTASMNLINSDNTYTQTRIEYLQQILGERLSLYEQIAPANYNDILYREYLIAIKNAYLQGSKKSVIENLATEFTKQKINLRELYLEARKPNSAYDISDTHMMIMEVFVGDNLLGRDWATLEQDLAFFVDVSKPAHVLYDTRFIWTDVIPTNYPVDVLFGDTGAGCVPLYITTHFPDAPILFYPPTGSTGISSTPTLVWKESESVSNYRLQVSTSATFDTTTFDQAGITNTLQNVTGLSGTCFWRVNATNDIGTSPWSPIWELTSSSMEVQCAMQIFLYPSPIISVEVNAAVMAALVTLFSTNNGETITFAQWTAVVTPLIPGSTYILIVQMIGDTVALFGSPIMAPEYIPPASACDFVFAPGTKGRFDLTKHVIIDGDDYGVSLVQKFS
jgi:hypothetical protein